MDLRTIVASYVDKAVDMSLNYTGDDKDTNRQIVVNLMTDRIVGSFVGILPPTVDLMEKYEVDQNGLIVQLKDEDEELWNGHQLDQLTLYASDRGYNDYHDEVESLILKPYNLQKQKESAKLGSGDT